MRLLSALRVDGSHKMYEGMAIPVVGLQPTVGGDEFEGISSMAATIEDSILEVVKGTKPSDEQIKIIRALRKSLPTDRWAFRWVIWGLIVVVLIPMVTFVLSGWLKGSIDITNIPQGLISLASTALGALAALITPGSHQAAGQAATVHTP
jgi:hypothetical protein